MLRNGFWFLLGVLVLLAAKARGQSLAENLDSARYYKFKNSEKALNFSKHSFTQAQEKRDTVCMAEALLIEGVAFNLQGQKDSALKFYIDAEKFYASQKNTGGLVDVFNELTLFNLKQKNFDNARQLIDTAVILAERTQDKNKQANTYNNKGVVFLDLKLFDSALHWFQAGFDKYDELDDNAGTAYSLGYMASVYSELKQHAKALECLQKSLPHHIKSGDKIGEAVNINNIGELLLQMNKPREALPYFQQAREKSQPIHFLELVENTYKMDAQCYEALGDFKKAYDAKLKETEVHEKILNEQQLKAIAELQTKYETGKKEQENRLLSETNLRQRLQLSRTKIIIAAIILIAIMGIGVLYLYYVRFKLKQENKFKEEQFEHERLRAAAVVDAEEHERKRLSRELHDGIGQTLAATRRKMESIGESIGVADANRSEVLELLDKSIKEVRQLSHNMMPPWLRNKTLYQAFEELKHQVQQSSQLKIEMQWDDLGQLQFEKVEVLMLYRSFQEMLSNIIKHAQASKVNVEVFNDEKELTIMVYDNGIGFDKEAVFAKGSGIGLKNIQSRIEYIGGTFEIDSHPGKGTTYTIYLPSKK